MILLAGIAVVAASCSAGSTAVTTTTTVSGSGGVDTATVAEPTTPKTEEPGTTLPPPTTRATAEVEEGATCLVGVWDLDMQQFLDIVNAEASAVASGAVMTHASGAHTMTFNADMTGVEHRDALGIDIATPEAVMTMVITDMSPGTYATDGETITWETAPGTGETTVEFLLDGAPFIFPGGVAPVDPPEASFTIGTFSCGGDTLVVTADGFSSTWSRIG
jgi:hypothetical protein